MSGFWSVWGSCSSSSHLGIRLFLFLWAQRVAFLRSPTGPAATCGRTGWCAKACGACRPGGSCSRPSAFVTSFGYLALYPGFGAFSGRLGWTSQERARARPGGEPCARGAIARAHTRQIGRGDRCRSGGIARRRGDLHRQLRRVSRSRGNRQPRDRRARPHGWRLAPRRRRQGDPGQYHEWTSRRDAGLLRRPFRRPDRRARELRRQVVEKAPRRPPRRTRQGALRQLRPVPWRRRQGHACAWGAEPHR